MTELRRLTSRKLQHTIGAILALACWLSVPSVADAQTNLYLDTYASLLKQYTRDTPALAQVTVDYARLREEPRWRRLLHELGNVDPSPDLPMNERLALFLNAYNIFAIDLVLHHYPIESIKDIGSFFSPVWKKNAGRIGGRPYSLDEIEHQILRPMGDPRVHAAVVCASISCPPLRREPYVAERIDQQLDDQMHQWLGNPRKGAHLDISSRTLTLSRIFKWFHEDFEKQESLLRFVVRYLHEADAKWVRDYHDVVRIRYFGYDWDLNE